MYICTKVLLEQTKTCKLQEKHEILKLNIQMQILHLNINWFCLLFCFTHEMWDFQYQVCEIFFLIKLSIEQAWMYLAWMGRQMRLCIVATPFYNPHFGLDVHTYI